MMKPFRATFVALAVGLGLLCCAPAAAQPTQEDVLRSIGESMDAQSRNTPRAVALLLAAAALTIVLVVLSQRRKREVAPRPLNHPGKLLREVSRSIGLKPAELKQLRILADQQGLNSPLTLLLCPSVLARALREQGGRLDRGVLAGLVKRLKAAAGA